MRTTTRTLLAVTLGALLAACGCSDGSGGGGGGGGGGSGGPDAGTGGHGGGGGQDTGTGGGGGGPDTGTGGGGGEEDAGGAVPGTAPFFVVDSLAIAPGDEGIDIDDDGTPDNLMGQRLSAFLGMANGKMQEAIEKGDLLALLELQGATGPVDSDPFVLNLYLGKDSDDDPDDNFSGSEVINIDPKSMKEDGVTPLIAFPNAAITDGTLDAQDGEFAVSFPLPGGAEGAELEFQLHKARIVGPIEGNFERIGDPENDTYAFLAGAAPRDDLETAIANVPEQYRALAQQLLPLLGDPDIDTDGDGTADAYSVSMKATAVRAIKGEVLPPEEEPADAGAPTGDTGAAADAGTD